MSKELLIAGGFEYSEIHENYFKLKGKSHQKLEKPLYYESNISGRRYYYDSFLNHGRGGNYRGYQDLPLDDYPYKVHYK